jgi:hypothetical protein
MFDTSEIRLELLVHFDRIDMQSGKESKLSVQTFIIISFASSKRFALLFRCTTSSIDFNYVRPGQHRCTTHVPEYSPPVQHVPAMHSGTRLHVKPASTKQRTANLPTL